MAEIKRITLHPLFDDGSVETNVNLYPKTLLRGIVDETGEEVEVVLEEELQEALNAKQNILVSGENIKTINNESLLGGGNIAISGGTKLYLHKIAKNEFISLYLFSTSGDSKVGKTLQQVLEEETTIDIKYKWYGNYHEIFFSAIGETYVPTNFSTSPTYGNPTPILNKSDEITIDYITEL